MDETVIEVSHISTARQSADSLTKNLVKNWKVLLNEKKIGVHLGAPWASWIAFR